MEERGDYNLVLVQFDVAWKNAARNRAVIESILENQHQKSDLIALPEMFTTGFCTEPEDLAETMDGDTLRWMKSMAAKFTSTIAGSLIIIENGNYFNRLIHASPNGEIQYYDKRHLFRMSAEEKEFTAGNRQLIINQNGCRINFQVCYDLRFPVWSRNRQSYDLLVYVANWPAQRNEVWDVLLRARAIENQSYVAGVNRIGTDGNGITYSGESVILDPKGKRIAALDSPSVGIIHAAISLEELNRFRDKFPVWRDGDQFNLNS